MTAKNIDWFLQARFGLFVHYGLYSILERGEWVMNRERLSRDEMLALARQFNPMNFDAEQICDLAVSAGMRYVNLTTMHHEGFRLYDTSLSDFNAMRYAKRDLVEEFVNAARQRGLKIALYHSLNNWMDKPDAVDALESKTAYEEFLGNTFARLRELVTRFNPVDILWYDGWWPFNAAGWQAERMNAMVREIQPHILFNGRNGLPGDFGTPEGHMSAPTPWRPWEGCITCNDHWSYHCGDHHWKGAEDVVDLLATAASARGNLMLNIGPRSDGSVPDASVEILARVGCWMNRNGEAIRDTDIFTYGLTDRRGHHSDWSHQGLFTRNGKVLYHLVRFWPGGRMVVAGLNTAVEQVSFLHSGEELKFTQQDGKVTVHDLPEAAPDLVCTVLKFVCADVPEIYLAGGMRIPTVAHPPYDPCPSDILHGYPP
jgi:alpha-L-fucosidase